MGRYNVKKIEYEATGEVEVHVYSDPIRTGESLKESVFIDNDDEEEKESSFLTEEEKREHSFNVSKSRTKNKVYDYARANVWEYFLTFTFSPDKVDRYSFEDTSKKMSKWFNNMRNRKAPDLKYLAVPEQHEDGAWHFHALVANMGEIELTDSGRRTKKQQTIYNCGSYNYGWTTATVIQDTLKAANYITKYITKELCEVENRKRYWCTRNLDIGDQNGYLIRDDEMGRYESELLGKAKRHKKIAVVGGDYYLTKNIYTLAL